MKTIPALVLAVVTLVATGARAGHSPLDGTFDGDGAALTALESMNAVAIQPDGKIVAVGAVGGAFAAVRLNTDGSPDTSFDGDGLAIGPAFSGFAVDVVLQADGKIVLLGDGADFTLMRFEANGMLDATFGSGGVALVDVAPNDEARCLAIQADGRLVGVGQSDDDLALFRVGTTGAPDPTFDGDGITTIDFSLLSEDGCVALQADGKILVSAQAGLDAAVLRYDVGGALDPTFDGDGIALLDLAADTFAYRVAVQADGRVLLAAASADGILLARFDAGGTLDPSFDGDGIAVTLVRGAAGPAIELLPRPDGRIVVVAHVPLGLHRLTVLRYEADGRRDPSFDGDGILVTNLIDEVGAIGVGIARGAALDAAGRVVVAAWAAGPSVTNEFYVLRYDVPPVCDPTPRLDCETGWVAADLRSLESRVGRERLVARLDAGPPLAQSAFGDPVALSGTQYRLCLYDDADRLVTGVDVDRAGEFCEGTACWEALGTVGYAYLDRERRADGTQRMLLRGGSTRSLITLLGRNRRTHDQWDLPSGTAERLLGSTSVTMQFVPSDAGCFSRQLTDIVVSTPTKFRAR